MHLRAVLCSAIETLEKHDIGSARLNAEILLMYVLDCSRAYLYAHPERALSPEEIGAYTLLILKRAGGMPSQYLTWHQEFWGLDFLVTPAVLIPRQETEHIVETVLDLIREYKLNAELQIADIGTGSGCIALALANELPTAKFYASDISEDALAVARQNAERLGLAESVEFRQGNLLNAFPEYTGFDFIVCNPPYVGEAAPEKVQREVREFEPRVAVFGGETGIEIYERLIPQAQARLKPGGWLVMEIGFSMEEAVRNLLSGWREIRTINDLQGIPRVIAARIL